MSEPFQRRQIKKRTEFHELIHAAFVLETSVSFYLNRPQPTEEELSWLSCAYPKSKIKHGMDQGAAFCYITPEF